MGDTQYLCWCNKRAASEPAEPPFSKRLGDIFITENNLEEMSQKIERLDKWRKHILNCREFLTLPDSQRVLRVASSMGWRCDRYPWTSPKLRQSERISLRAGTAEDYD
jgi:hypothetical protein